MLTSPSLTVAVLASGSRGNCTYIGDAQQGVLIDCGISTKQILLRLDASGLAGAPITAVLLTHEHSDHIASCAILERKLNVLQDQPVTFYATAGTRDNLPSRVCPQRLITLQSSDSFRVGEMTIEVTSICHDSAEAVAYLVDHHVRIGVITDLGRVTKGAIAFLQSLDFAVVEFNHDLYMLEHGEYPWHLQRRISGDFGHLSNTQAAHLLREGVRPRLQRIVLAHLSQENNRPDLALAAAHSALNQINRADLPITVATQGQPVGPFIVQTHAKPLYPPQLPDQQLDFFI